MQDLLSITQIDKKLKYLDKKMDQLSTLKNKSITDKLTLTNLDIEYQDLWKKKFILIDFTENRLN